MATVVSRAKKAPKTVKKAPAKKVVKKMPPKHKPVLVLLPVKLLLNPETWQVVGIQK